MALGLAVHCSSDNWRGFALGESMSTNGRNERLEQFAHRYVDLLKEVKNADRDVTIRRTNLDNLKNQLKGLQDEMKQFVGNNIQKRAVVIAGGIVVTIQHISETLADVCVYEDGTELR